MSGIISPLNLDIFANEISRNITLQVNIKFRGLKSWRIRTWIAVRLVKLAAFIGGFRTDIKIL